jgi:hypothetical protein
LTQVLTGQCELFELMFGDSIEKSAVDLLVKKLLPKNPDLLPLYVKVSHVLFALK